MSAYTLFLDNIDEYVNDENKIVTFKWLSQTLQVNCNTAKQMLYQYIQNERNNKDRDGLTVTYFLSGLSQPDEHGLQTFKCVVVPEQKLGVYKTTFAVMTSCHIYSVQKPELKDSNVLYMTDYDKFKENVFEANKHSNIQCERAVLRDQEEMEMLTLNTVPVVESKSAPKTTAATTSTSGKGGQKGMPKSAIANMFAKTSTSKKGADTDAVKKETKTEQPKPAPAKATGKAAAKKAGGVTAFFSKQTGKKADAPDKKEAKKPSPDKTASKKTPRTPDSDDEEEEVVRSKRRRTGQGLFDSDSSAGEEEMDVESEEPIPPTPPPTKRVSPTPQVKDSSPEVEVTKKAIPKKSPKEESNSKEDKGGNTETGKGDNTSGERRKYRRRKQVDKNYMDDEGFMVTEKVWESESASEAEDPIPKQVKKTAPAKSPTKGKKASPKKPSPGKKNSGKQTSLMSFFKKS